MVARRAIALHQRVQKSIRAAHVSNSIHHSRRRDHVPARMKFPFDSSQLGNTRCAVDSGMLQIPANIGASCADIETQKQKATNCIARQNRFMRASPAEFLAVSRKTVSDLAHKVWREGSRPRQKSWTPQSIGLMSTTGVPSMASMGPIRSRPLATSRTLTR